MTSVPDARGAGADRTPAAFDDVADDYRATLDQGLAVTGEDGTYFARARVAWLARRLARRQAHPRAVLDYGCGTGAATPFLLDGLGADRTIGVDVSSRSIALATRAWGSTRSSFSVIADAAPGTCDLAFCNGVFHHIPPADRARAVAYVKAALVPGGYWAFWENNPWNPGTRLVMHRLPFDRDAITLTPPEAARLLARGGFDVLETTFAFVFPSALSILRPLEPLVSRAPIGGQYLVLARKPATGAAGPLA